MPPRHFTNPAPKTDSARSALTSFHCALCNKSYSRHPEYEAHISSYDHQHKKRLRDLKQLSRDPNAAERARKAERKADAEAGLVVVDAPVVGKTTGTSSGGAGGFKKGGFKSSFTTIGGPGGTVNAKNVLGDEEDDVTEQKAQRTTSGTNADENLNTQRSLESDTDEEYADVDACAGGGYYDPRSPTDCYAHCSGTRRLGRVGQ